jgi:hypothetical protein
MKDTTKIILLVVLAILLIIVTPIISIWALNTVFPALCIPYTVSTWLAMLVLDSTVLYKSSKH